MIIVIASVINLFMYRLKSSLLKLILLIFSFISYSQENFTLNGYVLDENSNESIIGANIIIPSINTSFLWTNCSIISYPEVETRNNF